MRVVVCSELGPPDRLTIEERPSGPCRPGQVRIDVKACGINYVDGLFVQGKYQIKPPLPFVPGNEIAGVVTEIGADVTDVEVGARVFANVGLGGFTSEVVTDARRVTRTPDALSDGQAATFTQSYLTAWFALVARASAQAGEWLLALGAGGGVGLAAVDVGSALGLHVIAAASSEEKREAARAHGAEVVVDTATEDPKVVAREASGGGVDLVYDPVGGELGENALRALGEGGRYLVIGFASGAIPQLPANQILLRNRHVLGIDWGAWAGRHPKENSALLADVVREIEAGNLRPVEPVAYPLDDVARALDDQLSRRITGKAALVP